MNLVRANKLPVAALLFIVVLVIAGLSASWISPYDPFRTNHQAKLLPPSFSHPFGTDYLGRDLLSRVIHGIGDSVFPVFIVLSVVMLIGLFVGALSAFWGNKLDLLMMSVTDILRHCRMSCSPLWWLAFSVLAWRMCISR
ncbi:hypothetical protein HMSSN036_47720 [Paenibacillus macerans]|nr:hypothetical protein HMSSN036_47720 [Paenibacillus macerans]